jgi:hypothetical protein
LSRTSISVIIISMIAVICISHGRVPVLTPVDEHKRKQGKQSVEGRHLFQRWFPVLNREIPSVKDCALTHSFEETLWEKLPQGGDFRTERRPKLPAWGGSAGVLNRVGGGVPLRVKPAELPKSKERMRSSALAPWHGLLGSGSAPRTVTSRPPPSFKFQ